MNTSVVCVCLCLFVASNAFILNDGMLGRLMTFNMMAGRPALDMNMFGGSQQQNQAQQATGNAQTPQASGTAASQPASNAGGSNTGSSFFSNPLLFGLFGDGFMGF